MQRGSERDLVRRWASGELIGVPLCTTTGERLVILYPGRPGGGAGPDFRDAVIRLGDSQTLSGDVELHLRAGSWRAHGHASDPRYGRVILHVALENDLQPTRLPGGRTVPVLALADVVTPPTLPLRPPERWPCQDDATRLPESELLDLLNEAGRARFLEKADALLHTLDALAERQQVATTRAAAWSAESRALFVALAEGMGYGRDREAFRALGERLVEHVTSDGAALAPGRFRQTLDEHLATFSRLDRQRSRALVIFAARWSAGGPWPVVAALLALPEQAESQRALIEMLTFSDQTVSYGTAQQAKAAANSSAGRAAILVWNVALPFAYAWAVQHGDAVLAERALTLALTFPGLPPNQITRAMREQVLLPTHPKAALAQQGLHLVFRYWCQEKRCQACPCARQPV